LWQYFCIQEQGFGDKIISRKDMSQILNQNHLEIEYCTQCRWLLRAAWLAQEILTTFDTEIGRVSLVPGTGGIFEVRLNREIIFSRKSEARFPEAKEIKQLVRDRIAPDKPLGHSDH
jgi:selenoprotein W-related protein